MSAAVFSRGAQPPKRFDTGPLVPEHSRQAIASIHSTVTSPAQRAARRSAVMTTERVDETQTKSTRPRPPLPLFAQPLPLTVVRRIATSPAATSVRHHDSTGERHCIYRQGVDWSLVAALRAQASEQLSQAVAADRGRLDKLAQEELGRSIVLDLIEATVADRVNAGMPTAWSDR
jgi:hypothetical protein